ncbi:molybdopterin molybdenumtransferase MoeA [Methanobrevibacter sp. OttesenSCG-928-K11]|nr:molybdopterin molybdenumtransferase MoeA [Methanobrevibacter sp. OttesenSCG-928-K11]
MGTEFLKIKESNDAKEILQSLFNKYYDLEAEEINVEDSYGRILFDDVFSKMDFPSFNKALKDGFAIKAEDSYGVNEENPKTLKVIDFLEAGATTDKVVENGTCIEISTGAAMPEGADGVVMVEYSEKHDDEVDILTSITPSQDVAKKGSDITESKLILEKGDFLTPGKIGVLLSQGFKTIDVVKKPVVGVISTGNEIVSQGSSLDYGKIYDVNGAMIKNSAISFGACGKSLGIVKDNYDSLKSKILEVIDDVDVLICSGGTSAGLGDVVKSVLEELGEVHIHGISVQPGKPTIVGVVNDKVVIGLPGNPVSAIVIFNVFVAPYISQLAGINRDFNKKTVTGKLSKKIHSPLGRMQYQLVRFNDGVIEPIFKDSGAIFSLSEADGYVKVLKSVELVDVGEEMGVYLFN